ncbi:MAG: DMT family transporter [Succinivibrio sp.]|nr:DMT family transporter [Succinivibrio sp.]
MFSLSAQAGAKVSMFELRQYLLLFLTATIWGTGFIGQKLGMDHVSPFTFTFYRTFIGGLFLIPVILTLRKIKSGGRPMLRPSSGRHLLWGSLSCGACLIVAESFQQFGLTTTDVTKASFVTSMYLIFVPLLGIFIGSLPSLKNLFCVGLSVAGLYLLCLQQGSFAIERGDLLVLIGAVCFAVHILVIAHFINYVDGVLLSCGQFFVASALGFVMLCISGFDSWENIRAAAGAIVYTGVMSNGIAYTLQIVGQRGINPTIATLIMSLESVMGALFGVVLLDESLTFRQFTGCLLMFAAVLLAQIPLRALLLRRAVKGHQERPSA